MTFGEAKTMINTLNSGLSIPDNIADIMKLVAGKMSRTRLNDTKRNAEITVANGANSGTEFLLSTFIPDFLDFKLDQENKGRGPYFLQDTEPCFITVTNQSRFKQNTGGGFCYIEDGTLIVSWPVGFTLPTTLFVPIFSKYLVLDKNGGTLKEKPEDNDDVFIFNTVFDDVFIDGVLLYLQRKEMENDEYTKAKTEWSTALKNLAFYQ